MFRASHVLLITNSDLLPFLDDFSPVRAAMNLRRLASTAPVIQLSARRDLGLQAWFDWLDTELAQQRTRVSRGESVRPNIQSNSMYLHEKTI